MFISAGLQTALAAEDSVGFALSSDGGILGQ